jgi:hypothetical protein
MESIISFISQQYKIDREKIAFEAGFSSVQSLNTTISAGGNPKALKKLETLKLRLNQHCETTQFYNESHENVVEESTTDYVDRRLDNLIKNNTILSESNAKLVDNAIELTLMLKESNSEKRKESIVTFHSIRDNFLELLIRILDLDKKYGSHDKAVLTLNKLLNDVEAKQNAIGT